MVWYRPKACWPSDAFGRARTGFLAIAFLVPATVHSATVHWGGPGGDIWNTNSSNSIANALDPFALAWSSTSHDGDYTRPSGVVLADVGVGNVPYVFGSAGWGENRAYRTRREDGGYTPWTAENGQNDSGTGFRVAIANDASRVFHIDTAPVIRAYSTASDPAGMPLWSVDGAGFVPGLEGAIKVGPDGRVYGYRNGVAALDPVTGARVWWSAIISDPAPMPGAFWNKGATYQLVVATSTQRIRAYDIQAAPPAGPIWIFTDIESGYSGPTIDPVTGDIYVFRSTRVLKLTSAGALVWRSTPVGPGEFGRAYGALSRDGGTFYYHTGSDSQTGRLYAFRTSDGSIRWSLPTNGFARPEIGGPVVTANGLIFVGNAAFEPVDNRVLCVEDTPDGPVTRGQVDLRDEIDVGAPWLSIGPQGDVYFDTWASPDQRALFAFREQSYPEPAPTVFTAIPYVTTARLRWQAAFGSNVAGYMIYRRPSGGEWPTLPTWNVGPRADFTDYGLDPGETYEYRVAAYNSQGLQVSPFAEMSVKLLDDSASVSRHSSRDILIAFYTGGFSPAEVSALMRGLEQALLFYWRTSCGSLIMEPTWLFVDAPLPGSDWGSPALIDDLRARGVRDNSFDLAYLVGQGLPGCLGGYVVFGTTCASLGTACGAPYPSNDPDVDHTITWTFTHEIHHALEVMQNIAGEVPPEVLTCHFPWCYPDQLGGSGRHIDMSVHFDGIAALNRDYGEHWSLFPAPYDGVLECLDADGDGLPDDDDRVPMDELRFGSNILTPDTDADGLDDLSEFCRYNFRGSDPLDADTDNDGLPDGTDPEPLYRSASSLYTTATAPIIDGEIESEWPPLVSGYYFTRSNTALSLETFATWRSEGLYLAFEADRPLRFKLSIDASGQDGRWESPVRHVEGATDTENLDHKHLHIGDSWADDRHIAFAYGEPGMRVHQVGVIAGAEVASAEVGSRFVTEVFVPRTLPGGATYTWYPPGLETPVVDGLSLVPGHILGLAFTVSEKADSDDSEFSGTWSSVFETLALVDFELDSATANVDEPNVTRVQPGLYFRNPYPLGDPIRFDSGGNGNFGISSAMVEVYDVAGRIVQTLKASTADRATFTWDGYRSTGDPAAPGIYFLRARDGCECCWHRKLILVP